MTRRPRTCTAALFALCAAFASGCDELSDFRTGADGIYTGEVVGSDSDEGQVSFIRQGFDSHTRIDITFDPSLASAYTDAGGTLKPAGSIDTYVCRERLQLCPEADRVPGHFRAAALEPVPSLTHDALSQYDFPGGGRLRNYILVSRFAFGDEPALGQGAAMVFLSLMDTGAVEARVIAPSMPALADVPEQPALFGVFTLRRQAR